MKKQLGISGLMAALLLLGVVEILFAQSSEQKPAAAAGNAQAVSAAGTKPASVAVPEHVLYEFYFRRMAFFEDLVKKQASQSVKTTGNQGAQSQNSSATAKLSGAVVTQLDISGKHKAVIQKVATDALSQAAALDAQAAEIIKRHREQYAKKKAASSNKNKEDQPVLDLTALQAQREAIFTNAKASLSKQLTGGVFAKIDAHIKATISPGVKAATIP
jgi:hypothetical protein